MNSQELRALQEAYNQVYAPQELDEGYKSFPYDKVKAKVKKLKTDRESLGKKPLTGKSDSEIGDTLNKMEKSRNRETRLGLQSNTAHSFVPKQKEKSNRNRPESEKRSKTVEPQKSFGNRLTRSDKQGIRDSYEYDLYDIILSHLLDEGYADTEQAAEAIMVNMSEDWRESIVEGGFNSSGRYDVGGGRTVGPVAGAVRSLFSGNLPKGQTYVPPSPQKGTNRPPTAPSSKDDSGKLTDFGAGGGKAKMKTGMSAGQVERQGRMNKGDYSG